MAQQQDTQPARRSRTWFDGAWHEGAFACVSPATHGLWLGSSVFDGARWFDGLSPDLDLHCQRVNRSAEAMGLAPTMTPDAIEALAHEGIAGFDGQTAIYIKPMYWAEQGGFMGVPPDEGSTVFSLYLFESPMLEPTGFTLALSPFRRPTPEVAMTDAKAGCLYPNSGRAITEARARGFDNALMCDMLGNVAETATSNVFLAKDGVVMTPIANGCFLSGITRARVIERLRADGVEVIERSLRPKDFLEADELFSTGNHSKVVPITRFETVSFQPGSFYRRARDLYWSYAKGEAH
ncbi:branched-chain amino acid aminotransferase [Fulvimarina sp. 2208YS6-2-32]|uniref:Probable branched-chain-amino-acid aminotransferase n=1 Tax=Fulvimarina uroteuthidis TaxID=3098149 RepID=A0ABU5HZ17_9HYPH|nr:branched-chain amino acid aminotransferase [Fulvimarina sp. 2208YS6-2-32]MDY8108376.1 branched-chain amino acid aminotransferase [Fulvimarina sp. 2208YS6-2-32]